jgi:hypothetical protein
METGKFANLVRELSRRPSRRALNRAVASVVTGAVLARVFGLTSAGAKKKKKKKKGKDRKYWLAYCKNYDFLWCEGGYGDPDKGDWCCPSDPAVPAVCTDCGCCFEGYSKCCLPGTEPWNGGAIASSPCCADDESCCLTVDGRVDCCAPGIVCCDQGCCAPFHDKCCAVDGCCHERMQCCPDGSCRFACL